MPDYAEITSTGYDPTPPAERFRVYAAPGAPVIVSYSNVERRLDRSELADLVDRLCEARFSSDCAACGWRIVPGRLAKYSGDEVVHAVCPEDEPLRPVGEVCPTCFIERSIDGSCGCSS